MTGTTYVHTYVQTDKPMPIVLFIGTLVPRQKNESTWASNVLINFFDRQFGSIVLCIAYLQYLYTHHTAEELERFLLTKKQKPQTQSQISQHSGSTIDYLSQKMETRNQRGTDIKCKCAWVLFIVVCIYMLLTLQSLKHIW